MRTTGFPSGGRKPPGCTCHSQSRRIQGAYAPRSEDVLNRAGYSLIELVTVIALISIVMSSSTLLFVTMLRAERNTSAAVVEQQTLARLATQFRRDAHGAHAADVTTAVDGTAELSLITGTSEPVRYRIAGDRVERTAQVADGTHREAYRIRHASWQFVPPTAGMKIAAMQLKVMNDPGQPPSPSAAHLDKVWRIEAGLGLTPRLATKGDVP